MIKKYAFRNVAFFSTNCVNEKVISSHRNKLSSEYLLVV